MAQIKRALMVGMARSGMAAALLLSAKGAIVRLSDRKSREELGDVLEPLSHIPGVEYRLGEAPETLLDDVDLVVLSPGVPLDNPVVGAAQARNIPLIGELELAYRNARGRLIGITGTNGKTTTSTLVAEIFKNAGKMSYLVGNVGFPYSAIALDTREEDVTVCEVSSFQLETIREFRPQLSAILNIVPDHLNRHGTMAAYQSLKERIFENQREGDVLVLNYDDPLLRESATRAPCRVTWFAREGQPPGGAFARDGCILWLSQGEERVICDTADVRLPGPHNLENALAATALAMEGAVPAPVIRHTLRTFKGVEHRLESVRELDGVWYINDSKATNVHSSCRAIESMNRPTVLIAGGSTKNEDLVPLARAIQGSSIRYVVLVGEIAEDIAWALDQVGFAHYSRAGMDFERAVLMARSLAGEGWNVLLSPAGASFDLFRDYEQRGEVFRRIVNGLS
ncbi:MAG: UDP-N-acetylmuramoyl-L-alanine--D-glutamate ligase [Candidatus Excrementavichristensenella sp.]